MSAGTGTRTVPQARPAWDRASGLSPVASALRPRPVPAAPVAPQPKPSHLFWLCAWAAMLGFLGLAVGIRGMFAILANAPHWYQPTLVIVGLVGIAMTVATFLTVHLRYVPWLCLTLATGTLLASIIITSQALG